jgi:hypothetical protein
VKFSELCGFSDKQWQATHASDEHLYTLFGGSRGPGKSFWLRWYMVRFLMQAAHDGFPGMRVMLGCEDYPSLYERQVSKVQIEFPPWLGNYQAARNEYRLESRFGGGVIAFRNLDDPSKYQSAEFGCIGIDELTKNPERTFHILRASLRWKGFDRVRFVAATNPEANWVRNYWIERNLPENLAPVADQFAFVAALPDDNPHLPPSYWAMLDTLPGALRQAWRFGDWYAAVEGLVYDNFSEDNIVDWEPDPEQPVELAIDDGYIDPRATLFVQRRPDGAVFVFDELYEHKTLEETTIAHIHTRIAERGLRAPDLAVVSHEATALRDRLTEADIPAMNWLKTKAGGGKSTRLAAITETRSLICDGQGKRNLYVHRGCRRLLDELRAGYKYPEGKHGLETFPQDGNDHACQALETYVWARIATAAPAIW